MRWDVDNNHWWLCLASKSEKNKLHMKLDYYLKIHYVCICILILKIILSLHAIQIGVFRTVRKSLFSVGGSSAHSCYICASPKTLAWEVRDRFDTSSNRRTWTCSYCCWRGITEVCLVICCGEMLETSLLVGHVCGHAKDQINKCYSKFLFLSLEVHF